jgi:APA family basic amino acid/polyamine antiporter
MGHPVARVNEPRGAFTSALGSPAFAVGLVYISFSYSGWNAAAYIAGEVENPGRTLPRALLLGSGLVVFLYLAINGAFLAAAPAGELSGVVEVAHVAASRLFGQAAGRGLSAVIALCLFANIGALLMTGARVYEAMGRDYAALRALAHRGPRTGPIVAVALQAGAAIVMALTATFDGLLTYVGFTLSLTALLTIFGVFALRWREPALPRPYRVTGYPVTPLLAISISGWTILQTIIARPQVSIAGLGTLAAAAALYEVVRRTSDEGPGGVPRRAR